jgi:hypothetical protein
VNDDDDDADNRGCVLPVIRRRSAACGWTRTCLPRSHASYTSWSVRHLVCHLSGDLVGHFSREPVISVNSQYVGGPGRAARGAAQAILHGECKWWCG